MTNPPTVWVTTTEQQPVHFTVETHNKVIFSGIASPHAYTYINMPLELVVSESAPAAVVNRFKGIMVKAEDNKKIVVFAQYEESRSKDAYLALPVMSPSSSTTYKYILASVYRYKFSVGAASVGLIVGTEDDTKVTIIPPFALHTGISHAFALLGGFFPGLPDDYNTVTINRYQTLYLQVNNADISGTRVMTDKPVSVFSGHECAGLPYSDYSCDMIIEQILPTNKWGSEVVIVPLLTRYGYLIKIIAAEDNTMVTIASTGYTTGSVTSHPQFSLDSGEFRELTSSGDYTVIRSNHPISVYQFSYSNDFDGVTNSDPFMLLVPSRNQYLNTFNIATAPFWHDRDDLHCINIAVPAEYFRSNQIKVDNSPVTSKFKVVRRPDHSIWGYATQMSISAGSHVIKHLNPGAVMSVTVYGFSNQMSYGFVAGMKLQYTDDGKCLDNECLDKYLISSCRKHSCGLC